MFAYRSHIRLLIFIISSVCLLFTGFTEKVDASSRAKGLFKLCAQCHGKGGEGNMLYDAPAIAGLSAWYVSDQLVKFKNGGRGKHPEDRAGLKMRPMGRSLRDDDIAIVAKYVSELKPQPLKSTMVGNILKGEERFALCATCHGANAEGNEALHAPSLKGQDDWYLFTQLKHFKAGIRGANSELDPWGTAMAGNAAILSEQDMRDVIAYIKTFK